MTSNRTSPRWKLVLTLCAGLLSPAAWGETFEIPAERLRDQIRGGLLGQMLGNLNGLPHEMKYIDEPGNVTSYTPALPDGARTDDDTDFEWVYIKVMQDENCLLLPPARIAQLWKERINTRIWCSNQYARQLMDLGLEPPLTGLTLFNPWADFNISGQFICETFGLIAPAMPQTAAQLGLNYTRVTIDGEPAQTTQLFTTMIAQAFVTSDIDEILDAGIAAIDPASVVHQIVRDVRGWHGQHGDDWRATRQRLKDKYSKHRGAMRDRNGYELNTGATIAALLYGRGDFVPTLIAAFNFGWDADNSAATAGTIIGVTKGYRWMLAQGWPIVDRYHNTTRQNMPMDETITSFADRLIDLAERVIGEQEGRRITEDGSIVYRINRQQPACVYPLQAPDAQIAGLGVAMRNEIERTLERGTTGQEMARAAYCAICLDMTDSMQAKHPQQWPRALDALTTDYPNVVQAIFYHAPTPQGDALRKKALAAGLQKPATRRDLW
ncbi:MAG: ADP-ribosylglycohydrolase family protein [Phycisphaerales bacterium]|nr:MAG: ADP-ribosylglycohydrolase family protein [Phycisphaerales bacterium]